jgi:Protein of unknown function (DUF4065)
MSKLKDALAYILKNYPSNMADELSNARVTKMLYLADWKQAITKKSQITPINWYFDNYGPFVSDVKNEAEADRDLFEVNNTYNFYGTPKLTLSLKNKNYEFSELTDDEVASLNHVINETKILGWNSFIKLVYSTYPIASSNRYSILNLVEKAKEYSAQN